MKKRFFACLLLCIAVSLPAEAETPLFGSADEPVFLPEEEAFVLSAQAKDAFTIMARWEIADGYYLYRNKLKFALKDAEGVVLGDYELPPGKTKEDEFFGRLEVYYHQIDVNLPLIHKKQDTVPLTLEVSYQGCAEDGICYPPATRTTLVTLPRPETSESGSEMASEQDRIAASLAANSMWLSVITFFGFGLLLSFTPCVFPMIPILSGIIVGHGKDLTVRKAFILSLVYVLAMALTYTVAGIAASLFGANLQAAFQNFWVIIGFSAVFVVLSLSMFGFYELQMPAAVQDRLNDMSRHQDGGTLMGVAIMGFLSALIVGPCVAAPLAGALIYLSSTGDALLGGLSLFALSMGMGAPLLVIGASAGKLLPKAGHWMNVIKPIFGVLLLAVAVWMLERVLPGEVILMLWAALLIIPGVYMGALDSLPEAAGGWSKFWKGIGFSMVIWGVLLIIGAAAGGSDPLQPLRGFNTATGGSGPDTHLSFVRVKSVEDVQREVARANAQGKPAMLDFYADWCISCKEMERYTFADAAVQQALSNVVTLQADVTANDDIDKALLKHFSLLGPPSILFFGRNGQELRPYRLVGYMAADRFKEHVERALFQ
ncbi:MAG: protein-disulfide reductase DsbD [Gammaproteobacteria bacterium]|nr:protein-disulfide reductase DsbD [Gammaproteobacteria bacterium]